MPNLTLAVEHWKPGAAREIYAKFAAEGRGLPDSVRVLGSWTDPELTTCWQVMEGATAEELAQWREHWSALMDIDIRPVITGAEARRRAEG
ncbi:DUF3303 domain-containing protein [Nocardioides aquiterrae]|uniref:DUF3303 domain-containing protein n=1 Tax=Nocardioides aquiterrae TaxID=203799 RepID=A0ABP4FAL0_9ACTN